MMQMIFKIKMTFTKPDENWKPFASRFLVCLIANIWPGPVSSWHKLPILSFTRQLILTLSILLVPNIEPMKIDVGCISILDLEEVLEKRLKQATDDNDFYVKETPTSLYENYDNDINVDCDECSTNTEELD